MSSDIRVWVNGGLVDPADRAISAVDHGITVGDGVFETAKVVDGAVFALTRHADRLDRSLAGLGLGPADRSVVETGIAAVLQERVELGRLRWTVTAGLGPLGSDRGDSGYTYIVTVGAMPPTPASGGVVVVPWTRNERAATAGLKTTSYADNVIALAYAKERGASEAIFANTRGELCEGTGSNIFVVLGDEIVTPPLTSGALAGITRELVLQWCREDGIRIREEALPVEGLAEADEVFITSSIRNVMPVDRVDDRELAVGAMTTAAAESFVRHSARSMDP
ncbi:MAG: aminotransferase class IV [Intrasporangiaceae bacterium]|nr:aminotransferase class IV [Intrasporangiaceae bacterium]